MWRYTSSPYRTACLEGATMQRDFGHHIAGQADLYGSGICWLPPIRLLQGFHEPALPVHCGHQTV